MLLTSAHLSTVRYVRAHIRRYLERHPASPVLAVAQAVWHDLAVSARDVHCDSWLWIREQMEQLAAGGVLRRQESAQGPLWSVATSGRS